MKKNYLFFVTLLMLSFFAPSCTKEWFGISGSGEIKSEERLVSGFEDIELDLAANVEIVYDSVFSVEVRDYENLLSHIATEVRGDALIIHRDPRNVRLRNSEATIRISMPSLHAMVVNGSGEISLLSGFDQLASVVISGSGEVSALEPFISSDLTLAISGSGKIMAAGSIELLNIGISGSGNVITSGTADQLNIKISGSGRADCYELEAQQATCKISGSGDAWVNVVKELHATISGSGNVIYIGDPVVTASISGSGKVKSRD